MRIAHLDHTATIASHTVVELFSNTPRRRLRILSAIMLQTGFTSEPPTTIGIPKPPLLDSSGRKICL
jgi:hypothetical protein